jgi:hypothetical protein
MGKVAKSGKGAERSKASQATSARSAVDLKGRPSAISRLTVGGLLLCDTLSGTQRRTNTSTVIVETPTVTMVNITALNQLAT